MRADATTTLNRAIARHNKRHAEELKEIAEIYEQQQKADFCDAETKKDDARSPTTNENTTSRAITQPIFKSYKELNAEIHKRDYENIKGLKAEITEKEYNYFLEVLPPLNWKQQKTESSFIMSEALTDDIHEKMIYDKVNNKYYCEVVIYELSEDERGYF